MGRQDAGARLKLLRLVLPAMLMAASLEGQATSPPPLEPSVRAPARADGRLQLRGLGAPLPEPIAAVLGLREDSLRATPRGVLYDDLRIGAGDSVRAGDSVAVHFVGYLANGTAVTKSRDEPFRVRLGVGKVIEGWEDGLPGMRVGGTRQLVIPAALAYGAKGSTGIPPNATLVFDVMVVERRP